MKKLCILLCLTLVFFSFAACSKIEETDAKRVANQLFEHIEAGNYTSASALFCANEDEGKSFSEFLDEVEIETGLDFQSKIEILEYSDYHSAQNNYFGVICAELHVKAIVDGEEILMCVGVLENENSIECYQFVIYTETNDYQYLCDYID